MHTIRGLQQRMLLKLEGVEKENFRYFLLPKESWGFKSSLCSDIPVDMWGKDRHQTPNSGEHPRETAGFALQLLDILSRKDLSATHDTSFCFPELIFTSEFRVWCKTWVDESNEGWWNREAVMRVHVNTPVSWMEKTWRQWVLPLR